MGVLSGKYRRGDGRKLASRSAYVGEIRDRDHDIIDQLAKTAAELGSDVAAVALAWTQGRPGVASTIIGARTMEHLEANLKALELKLTPEQIAALDAVSRPTLNFPAEFNANLSPNFSHAGATVDGVPSKLVGNVPRDDAHRY